MGKVIVIKSVDGKSHVFDVSKINHIEFCQNFFNGSGGDVVVNVPGGRVHLNIASGDGSDLLQAFEEIRRDPIDKLPEIFEAVKKSMSKSGLFDHQFNEGDDEIFPSVGDDDQACEEQLELPTE